MKKLKKRRFMNAEEFYTIRELYYDGETQNQLAEENKCSQPHICRIVSETRQPHQSTLFKKEEKLNSILKTSKTKAKNIPQRKRKTTKLTLKKVQKIRELYFSGKCTQKELTQMYKTNVSQSQISRIISGKRWA